MLRRGQGIRLECVHRGRRSSGLYVEPRGSASVLWACLPGGSTAVIPSLKLLRTRVRGGSDPSRRGRARGCLASEVVCRASVTVFNAQRMLQGVNFYFQMNFVVKI